MHFIPRRMIQADLSKYQQYRYQCWYWYRINACTIGSILNQRSVCSPLNCIKYKHFLEMEKNIPQNLHYEKLLLHLMYLYKYTFIVLPQSALETSRFTFQVSNTPSVKIHEKLNGVFCCISLLLWKVKISVISY